MTNLTINYLAKWVAQYAHQNDSEILNSLVFLSIEMSYYVKIQVYEEEKLGVWPQQ